MRVSEIISKLELVAPPQLAEQWDNVGLQVGDAGAEVDTCLVTLDVTCAVVAEACSRGAQLIIAHHPLIFEPLREVRADNPATRALWDAIRAGLCVYVAHTNLDAAPRIGTAAALCRTLELKELEPLIPSQEGITPAGGKSEYGGMVGLGRIVQLDRPTAPATLARWAADILAAERCRVAAAGPAVQRVAVMPGAAGSALGPALRAGVEALLCGELQYHSAMHAKQAGITVIELGHYATERPVVEAVCSYLQSQLPQQVQVLASAVRTDPYQPADEGRVQTQ